MVVATCNYMHQIVEGKQYRVTGYLEPVQYPTFRFPAYVEVTGDFGTPVLGHTHRFRALRADESVTL
jgi:hypothetical protein